MESLTLADYQLEVFFFFFLRREDVGLSYAKQITLIYVIIVCGKKEIEVMLACLISK